MKTAPRIRDEAAERLAAELAALGVERPQLALVLGSGLGAVAAALEDPLVLPAASLEELPRSAVAGHAGRLVFGEWAGRRVLIQEGRVHLYEGWSVEQVTRSVRAFGHLGCRGLVLTNAAGSLRSDWPLGGFMAIEDHINLQGQATLAFLGSARGCAYSRPLGDLLASTSRELGLDLQSGVYAGLLGPSYETPAEIQMLRRLGVDAVGMSTVAEAVAGRGQGLQVLGLSCLTNPAAGIGSEPLDHAEVLEAGKLASESFLDLFEAFLPRIDPILD